MIAKGKLPRHKLDDILKQNANCCARIVSFLEWQLKNADLFTLPPHGDEDQDVGHFHFDPATLIGKISDNESSMAQSLALKKEFRKYSAYIQKWQTHFTRETEQQAKAQFLKLQSNVGAMCGVAKGAKSAHISRLRIQSKEKGKPDEITTNPEATDKALQDI